VDCFENSDGVHDGHNFEIVRNPEKVMCDCGDSEALEKNCFCREHGGTIDKGDSDIILSNGKDNVFYKKI
jgi:hypothetical protein